MATDGTDVKLLERRASPVEWLLPVGDRLIVAARLFGAPLASLLALVYFDRILVRRTSVLYRLLTGLLVVV